MTKRLLACSITVVALTVASPALADPITIVSNGSGISGLAYATENGIEDMASDPDTPGGSNSFHLTAQVGGTTAEGFAAIASDLSDPLRLRANGSTSVSYTTEIGREKATSRRTSSCSSGSIGRADSCSTATSRRAATRSAPPSGNTGVNGTSSCWRWAGCQYFARTSWPREATTARGSFVTGSCPPASIASPSSGHVVRGELRSWARVRKCLFQLRLQP